MTRELLHIGHDDGLATLPGGATDAAPEGDVHAGYGALEGAEHELAALAFGLGFDAVEAGPPEAHRFVDGGGDIRHHRHHVALALYQGFDLLTEQGIFLNLFHSYKPRALSRLEASGWVMPVKSVNICMRSPVLPRLSTLSRKS